MRTDIIERSSLHLYSRLARYADLSLPQSRAIRAGIVVGTALSLQLEAVAELAEQVFMAVMNVMTFSGYDALVYVRKSAFSLVKVAVCPFVIIGLPIIYYSLAPNRKRLTTLSDAVVDVFKIYRNVSGLIANNYLPRPAADMHRILSAIDHECKNLAKLDWITERFVQAQGDSFPIFITDEWHRYWQISKWQKSEYREKEPIVIHQLLFAGWHYGGDSDMKSFTLLPKQTNQLRNTLSSNC